MEAGRPRALDRIFLAGNSTVMVSSFQNHSNNRPISVPYLVRGLDVAEPRLLVGGDLVDVDAVDEALHARVKDHNLPTQKNGEKRDHKNTRLQQKQAREKKNPHEIGNTSINCSRI